MISYLVISNLINPNNYDLTIISDGLKKCVKIMETYKKSLDVSKDYDFQECMCEMFCYSYERKELSLIELDESKN